MRHVLVGAVLCGAWCAAAWADEDWRKLADRQPAWQGPETRGVRLDPGALRGEGYDAFGVSLLAHLPLASFGATGNGNSCYGYVSPSGREYAIMGTSETTGYVDITDPLNPVVVANIPHTPSLWCDIKTHGHYAYTSNESGGGIQVIDLGQIDQGIVTLVRNITTNGMQTVHTLAVDNVSGFLYAAGSNMGNGSIAAFSLADPANPVFAGRWTGTGSRYCHEAQVLTYATGPMAGRQVAYSFDGAGGLDVLDITNKSAIVRIGQVQYSGLGYCHQGWLSQDQRYLYINDELDEINSNYPTRTRIVDVQNPAAPAFVGEFGYGINSIDHNLYVRGNYIFESNYRTGLRIFDATNPAAPVQVAWFDSYPADNNRNFNGNWNNYPYFPSGTVIISDMERGLFVLDVDVGRLRFTETTVPPEFLRRSVPNSISMGVQVPPAETSPTITMHMSFDGGPYQPIPMSRVVPGRYSATVTPTRCEGQVAYYFSATGTIGSPTYYPEGGESTPIIARVVDRLNYTDRMDVASVWSLPAGAGNSATAGRWENGVPQATAAQPGSDHTISAGRNCWVTGLINTNPANPNANDVDGGSTTLLSQNFNLAVTEPGNFISYWRYFSAPAGSPADTLRVEISGNGGGAWTLVESISGASAEELNGWRYHEFRVSDILPVTGNMRIRFVATDGGPDSLVEAAIDDLNITSRSCTPEPPPPPPACACDWNGRDGLDSQDFFDFLDAFFQGTADFNRSGSADSQDLFDFLECFFNGC